MCDRKFLNSLLLQFYTLRKDALGFETRYRLNRYVKRDDAKNAIQEFVGSVPETNHNIKLITIVLMAHGGENDR